jgi:hypothetical protein
VQSRSQDGRRQVCSGSLDDGLSSGEKFRICDLLQFVTFCLTGEKFRQIRQIATICNCFVWQVGSATGPASSQAEYTATQDIGKVWQNKIFLSCCPPKYDVALARGRQCVLRCLWLSMIILECTCNLFSSMDG